MAHALPQAYLLTAALFDRPEQDAPVWELVHVLANRDAAHTPGHELMLAVMGELSRNDYVPGELDAEYNRLFVFNLPRVPAQPYASWWLEPGHELMGAATRKLGTLMAARGMAVSPDSGLSPDHIVTELELMACLVEEGEAAAGDRRFLREHLLTWAPHFLAAVRAARPLVRYRLAADLLDRLLKWEAAQAELPWWGCAPHVQLIH
jgi:TorA maturation chaperone TorD